MPELPAMENFRRAIEKQALNQKISAVMVKQDRVVHDDEKTLASALKGVCLTEALRHGKYVFIKIGNGKKPKFLAFHCGMTGYFMFPGIEDDAPKAKLLLRFSNGQALAFFDPRMFGNVALIEDMGKFIIEHDLGPDASSVTLAQFKKLLTDSAKPLKVFFLDQSIMAGIGNVYGDEIPFNARLSPKRKADSLTADEATQLYQALKAVLKIAIQKKAYLDHWDMLPPEWLVHYREDGTTCPRCQNKIESYKAGGRDGYWCPGCQL